MWLTGLWASILHVAEFQTPNHKSWKWVLHRRKAGKEALIPAINEDKMAVHLLLWHTCRTKQRRAADESRSTRARRLDSVSPENGGYLMQFFFSLKWPWLEIIALIKSACASCPSSWRADDGALCLLIVTSWRSMESVRRAIKRR